MSYKPKTATGHFLTVFRNVTQRKDAPVAATPEEIQRMLRADSPISASGAAVTSATALRVAAVYACVRLLCDAIAMLPVGLYKQSGDRATLDKKNSVHRVLALRPNPVHTPFVLWRLVMAHLLLRGNFYAQKVVSGDKITALLPLNPDNMDVKMNEFMEVFYHYQRPDGRKVVFSADEIFHLRGLCIDGLKGISVLEAARNSIGLAIDAESHGSKTFRSGAKPSGVLKTEQTLTAEAAERLRDDFERANAGLENVGRTVVLEQGLEWQQVTMSNDDAQFIENRKFSRSEIAMFFGVPPHAIGDLESGTSWGTGIEQQNLGFLVHTLNPYLVNIAQQVLASLIPVDKQADYVVKFDTSILTRADFLRRQQGLNVMRRAGVINANEWRKIEGFDPIEDEAADDYLVDQQLVGGEDPEPIEDVDDDQDEGAAPIEETRRAPAR